uniref:Uncharacterized protein n=1 Tax=Anguilla anguilla TaxID=7936 RepID=A0A0E9XUC0_ANGAN
MCNFLIIFRLSIKSASESIFIQRDSVGNLLS